MRAENTDYADSVFHRTFEAERTVAARRNGGHEETEETRISGERGGGTGERV